ncbi:MAG TPA: ABC transporter permease [Chryseosolibacter sp.]
MLKNILITSLRNFFRNRSFSLINLVGLSVSMSLAMLIIMIIKEQYTFDNFHKDSDRIFRVNTKLHHPEWGSIDFASAPIALGQAIKDDYSFSENVVRINRQLVTDATYGNVNVGMKGLLVDPSFVEVFNFPFEKGNAAKALTTPNSLVLTQRAAEKVFGRSEPIGQTITLAGFGEFTVTGVLKELTSKTHLDFEMLCSISSLPMLEEKGVLSANLDNWSAYYNNYVYIKLKDGQKREEVERALGILNDKYAKNLTDNGRDIAYTFYLQPLGDITPGPELGGQMGHGMPAFFVLFLGVLAAVVLLMSVFNFTNLTIAKSLSRAREIGIRKVVGAKRSQVFFQFVGEAILFSLIALVFSYLLLQFLKTGYLQLSLNEDFVMNLEEDLSLYLMFVAFAMVVGLLAGVLPASYLSAFKTSAVLKDAKNLKVYSRLTFRKVLMVTQFTLSVIFVIVSVVIYRQVNFMLNADYGIEQKNNLSLHLRHVPFEKIAEEIRSLPGVVSVGGVSHKLGTFDGGTSRFKRSEADEAQSIFQYKTDDQYIRNLSLTFLAGRNFEPFAPNGIEKEVILNESAIAALGFGNPIDAVGQTVLVDDTLQLQIAGVVRDFHFRPMNNKIGPLALRFSTSEIQYLNAKINPVEKENIVASIAALWKKYDAVHPAEYMMMEQEIDEAYRESGMQDMVVIIGYTTFLVISLACLGMLGMAMYASQVRVKEVGIRKVMGASVADVTMLLSKSFMVLIGVAISIGVPVSYILGELFLEGFAYKAGITPLMLGASVSVIIVLGLLTVWSQTIVVALANPVKWLRHE